jgi:TetR/AcrR family transcriptional repressor of nem operon
MRKSRDVTAASKTRIIAAAAKMLRARGFAATSVADVMHEAGMTHGGFYKHFQSKDELAAVAVRSAFETIAGRFDQTNEEDGPEAAAAAYLAQYLSKEHVEHPELGCPMAALGAEASRHPGGLAQEFHAGAEQLIERLTRARADRSPGAARAEAIRTLLQLVGTVIVARAVGAGPLRDEVLAIGGAAEVQ